MLCRCVLLDIDTALNEITKNIRIMLIHKTIIKTVEYVVAYAELCHNAIILMFFFIIFLCNQYNVKWIIYYLHVAIIEQMKTI